MGPSPQHMGGFPQQQSYQGGMYQPQPVTGQPGSARVIVAQPVMIQQDFREDPVHTRCPHCQAEIVTALFYDTGTFTWLICAVLCVCGCDAGCCLFPFCIDGCKDVVHSCPNCHQIISRYNKM